MYGKLFRQMYRGTLAKVGPWEALVTFQQMIILADGDGVVDMTADAISRETTIPLEVIIMGIEALEKPDPESRTPDEEGRRIIRLNEHRTWGWRITNYAHYRKLKSEEERREYHRQYWHKRKAAQQETQHDSTNSIQEEEEAVRSKNLKPLAPEGARVENPEANPAFREASRLDKRKAWIEGKAAKLGLHANAGETWATYAQRVKEA